jgi:D-serine deaminase-like pyridoxal phosphate-dependent protein
VLGTLRVAVLSCASDAGREGQLRSTNESVVEVARDSTGLATVYRALDDLVDLYALADATVVVDVPGFGRQVLHAGRRPLRDDEQGMHAAEPGLYLDPPLDDPVLSRLMLALGTLALRHDAGDTSRS